jgi:deazaflavin-dependent oxidoreductase (nitroreductase family)
MTTPSIHEPQPKFRSWQWRFGNMLVSLLARLGVGPIELLSTTGRRTGKKATVPVVPVDHAGRRWLVAPYGPFSWVHNVRATPIVTLRYGRRRRDYAVSEVAAEAAAPVLKRYVSVATRAQRRFQATVDAPEAAFVAEVSTHPVFALEPR